MIFCLLADFKAIFFEKNFIEFTGVRGKRASDTPEASENFNLIENIYRILFLKIVLLFNIFSINSSILVYSIIVGRSSNNLKMLKSIVVFIKLCPFFQMIFILSLNLVI